MRESFLNGKVILHPGDCLDVLKTLEPNSVDSCVTDPPYHLTNNTRSRSPNPGQYTPIGKPKEPKGGFMGKKWDGGDIAFRVELWTEVLRVLKPGAHLVAFGGTRTYHRMACAIEDAGFEIRDSIQWLYGSGFPKSLDVSKAIDRARDDSSDIEHVRRWLDQQRQRAGITRKAVNAALGLADNGGGLMSSWTTNRTTACIPQWQQWLHLKSLLKFNDEMDAEVWRLNGRKGTPGEAWFDREKIGEGQSGIGTAFDHEAGTWAQSKAESFDITSPATDAARQWQGFGTALKPACEPIVLARKPLIGTVAENVLKHGTGALNIDGCRVAGTVTSNPLVRNARGFESNGLVQGEISGASVISEGRWPANVIHDGSDEVVGAFPTVGNSHPPANEGSVRDNHIYGSDTRPRGFHAGFADSGSAARFFYTAKADADDRLGSKHPTVKPVDLIQYLCRLVTPPGGLILDCFAGTGTTGEAAWRAGFRAILIEREAEYCDDIRRRMALCLAGPQERKRASAKARHGDKPLDEGLFA